MISKRISVEGLGTVVQSEGNLSDNFNDLGGGLISLRDEAYSRIKTAGKEDIGKFDTTRTAVELNYIRNDFPVAIKYDRLSREITEWVVNANYTFMQYICTRSTERYDTNRKIAERENKDGVPYEERKAIILPRGSRENKFGIPCKDRTTALDVEQNMFSMSPLENTNEFKFFLEDMAAQEGENSYFAFNKNTPIKVYLINKDIIERDAIGTCIVPYILFDGLCNNSELWGDDRHAGDRFSTRGILKSAESVAISEKAETFDAKKTFQRLLWRLFCGERLN